MWGNGNHWVAHHFLDREAFEKGALRFLSILHHRSHGRFVEVTLAYHTHHLAIVHHREVAHPPQSHDVLGKLQGIIAPEGGHLGRHNVAHGFGHSILLSQLCSTAESMPGATRENPALLLWVFSKIRIAWLFSLIFGSGRTFSLGLRLCASGTLLALPAARRETMRRIRFHGRGGQGMKTASRILGSAAFHAGFIVQDSPVYGAERRGAPMAAF